MAYFLVSVSNRTNLELCVKYALAGFTNSGSGLWTYLEIAEGDFVSFLYGAKVHNLYQVSKKEALRNAEKTPPWPPITFKISGKSYFFPFRLHMNPVREFTESMVRPEFAYVAENLLLRGGYRRTHFQADQTTLQSVSQMGSVYTSPTPVLDLNNVEAFVPRLTWDANRVSRPEVYKFQEYILQSLLRRWLSKQANLQRVLDTMGSPDLRSRDFEVLGEKALPEGHVDLLIKDIVPLGNCRKIVVEVKAGKAQGADIEQLRTYVDELGRECVGGILVCKEISERTVGLATVNRIGCFVYSFQGMGLLGDKSVEEVLDKFRMTEVQGGPRK